MLQQLVARGIKRSSRAPHACPYTGPAHRWLVAYLPSAYFRPPWSTASRSAHATLARRPGAGWVVSEGSSGPSSRDKQPDLPKGTPRRTTTCQTQDRKNSARAISTPARLAACPARARSRTQPQNAHYGPNEPGQMKASNESKPLAPSSRISKRNVAFKKKDEATRGGGS